MRTAHRTKTIASNEDVPAAIRRPRGVIASVVTLMPVVLPVVLPVVMAAPALAVDLPSSSPDLTLEAVSPGADLVSLATVGEPGGADFDVVAGAWLARLGGEVTLGAGNAPFRIDQVIRNDDLEVTPLVEFSVLDDEGFMTWRLHAFHHSSDATGLATEAFDFGSLSFAAGDPYETDTDYYSFGVEHGIHRFNAIGDGEGDSGDVSLDFTAIGGLRVIGVDQEIGIPGGAAENPSEDWIAAYAAARMDLVLAPAGGLLLGDSFRLTGEYGVGVGLNGGGGGIWHVRAGGELRFTESIRGFFGYRLLELDLEGDGDWTFDSGLQGLFIGATIEF